jgi:hypothetical protein
MVQAANIGFRGQPVQGIYLAASYELFTLSRYLECFRSTDVRVCLSLFYFPTLKDADLYDRHALYEQRKS